MHFFRITLNNTMVYGWSVLFKIVGSIIFIAVNILLWRYLYRHDDAMVVYMTQYTIVANIISLFYVKHITARIGDKVSTGSFATDLVRPINLFSMAWQMELADVCASIILRGIPIVLTFLPVEVQYIGNHPKREQRTDVVNCNC